MYYDTLNARDWTPDLQGFNVTTTNPLSNDFGQTFALGDPRNGILPLANPFPVRAATGSRYEAVLGNALGLDTMLGRDFDAENPNRTHSRVQRWRLGWQRELASRTALEVAYSGSYADRQGITIRQDFLPEQYWSSANVRDTSANDFLTAERAEPVQYRELRLAPDDQPAALPADAGIHGLHVDRPSSATVCCGRFHT